jgi:5-methylthioadenosine/S-adenosylhomocysteine deaminase
VKSLVTAAGPGDVTDSIINGKLVMENREVLTLDEEKIIAEATVRQKQIFARAGI